MADSPVMGTGYLRIAGDFSQLNAQAVGLFGSSKWGKMGKAAGAALAGGLVAGGALKGLYEIGQAFDDASDKIRVTTGANEKQLARLNKSFKNVVSDVPADFDSASTAIADLNQRLGLTGKPLQKMSKQMLELSRITDTDVKTNIESVSKSFRDWEVKTKDQTSTLDAFFRLSQKSGVSVADLASQVQKFGSPLRQLGFSLDESAAMFANFERSGVNTQTMVPGLKLAISNLTRPTDELGASMEKLGVNVGKPDVALRQVFDLMSEKGLPTVEKTGLAMDVFGKRAGADMAEAIKQGRFEVDDLLKVMKDGSETIRKAGRETMDFGEHWQKLKNNVFVALEPVAKKVFGTLGDEMERVTDILTDRNLSKDEKFTAILDRIGELSKKYGPKIAEAGGKIGIALIKGVAGAFMDSSILGKLFIGGAALKLFGGPGVLGKAGASLAKPLITRAALAMGLAAPASFGPVGFAIAAAIAAGFLTYEFAPDIADGLLDKTGITKDMSWLIESVTNAYGDWGSAMKRTAGVALQLGLGLEILRNDFRSAGRSGEFFTDSLLDGVKDLKRFERHIRNDVGGALKEVGGDFRDYAKDSDKYLDDASKSSERHRNSLDKDGDKIGSGLKTLGGVMTKYSGGADKNFGKVTSKSAQMERGVGRNVNDLANAVAGGFDNIGDNTDEMLGKLGVKKLGFSIKGVGQAASKFEQGGIVKAQQGAAIVPGTSSGDTVPLHIGGQLAAMVEPREQVSVLNRTATAAMMAINARVPRRAAGGMVDPAGPGTGVVNSAIANVVGAWSKRYDAAINYGYDPGGGHVSAGHNVTGTATDTGPAAGWGAGPTSLFEQGLRAVLQSGLSVLYGSHGVGTAWPNHGWGNHAHIEWGMHPEVQGIAAAAKKIKRILLKGPKGPMRDLGQAGLDKSWKAANAYIAKQAPSGIDNGGRMYSGPLDRDFGSGNNQQIPFNSAAMLAEMAGLPGVTYGQIAIGESNLTPGAVSSDGGYGLWQMTPRVQSAATVSAWKKIGSYFNPWNNARMAKVLAGSGTGVSNYYGTGSVTDFNKHYTGPMKLARGGIAYLAGGGKPDKKKPRMADVWEQERPGSRFGDPIRGSNALKAALKAQKKLGRLGRSIAIQDELIDRTDRLASLESGPAGSELSLGERDSLIGLNTALLRKLAATGALSAQGLTLTERGMKNASGSTLSRLKGLRGAFKESQVEALGLTGKSGRVFDTKLNLRGLRNTPLGSAATAETRAGLLGEQLAALTAQLRISQGQYGAFGDYFPKAHSGGILPGPVGQERPFIGLGGEQILTRDQQRGMSPHIETNVYVDPFSLDTTVETIVDGKLRKVAKQTARRVPTGRI